MRKSLQLFLILASIFISCNKNEDNTKPDYSFESIVDSSFYCSVRIGDSTLVFSEALEGTGFNSSIFVNDSATYGSLFTFIRSSEFGLEYFTIKISKSFNINELEAKSKLDSTYFPGNLTSKEFLSIYSPRTISYSSFDTNYIQCMDCALNDGAAIDYRDFTGNLWKTSYTAIYLDQDSLVNFYKDCKFSITKLQTLDENHIVIEGTFDVKIFNWYTGKYIRFSNGYFKTHKSNP